MKISQKDISWFNLRFPFPPLGQVQPRRWSVPLFFQGPPDLYPLFGGTDQKNRGTDQPLNHNLICTSSFLAFPELRSENSRKTGVQIRLICTLVLRKNRGTDQLFTADLGAMEKIKKLICTPIFISKSSYRSIRYLICIKNLRKNRGTDQLSNIHRSIWSVPLFLVTFLIFAQEHKDSEG